MNKTIIFAILATLVLFGAYFGLQGILNQDRTVIVISPETDVVIETETPNEADSSVTETVVAEKSVEITRELKSFHPIPEIALGPVVPADQGYVIEQLGRGLYWVMAGTYQVIFLSTGHGVIVVDAPPAVAPILHEAIASVTDEEITHVIYSHAHKDHIGGASIIAEGKKILAHPATAKHLKSVNDPNRPIPNRIFGEKHQRLNIYNQTIDLDYHGPNHTSGNYFIYAPEQKVLMVVDIMSPGWAPFMNFGIAEDMAGYIAVFDQILSYDFDVFVGGHSTRYGTRKDVEMQKSFVMDVMAFAGEALQNVDFAESVANVDPQNGSAQFAVYLDDIAKYCQERVHDQWLGVLGGVDAFSYENCKQMAIHLFVH